MFNTVFPSPFYHWQKKKAPRTAGIADEVLQPYFENPLFDMSGPTDANRRNILITQGAMLEGPMVRVISGTQGVINDDEFEINGLIPAYTPETPSQ